MADGFHLEELPFLTQLSVRADPGGPGGAAVERALGCPMPGPCTLTRAGQTDVLWLGPDEFLLLAPPARQALLSRQLRMAIGTEFATVTDVSAQRVTLDLSGPGVRDVLAQGCAIDLDPRVSPPGTCVQTLLARAGVILLVDDPGRIRLLVRPSYAPYLTGWLADARAGA